MHRNVLQSHQRRSHTRGEWIAPTNWVGEGIELNPSTLYAYASLSSRRPSEQLRALCGHVTNYVDYIMLTGHGGLANAS